MPKADALPLRTVGLPAAFVFGACELDVSRRQLLLAGRQQAIAPKVFALLCCLIEHRARVVSKDELVERVWRGSDISDAALVRAVMKARKAIGDTDAGAVLIRTVHRVGYRFTGEVRTVERHGSLAPSAARQRVGLLPIENATGDEALDWVGHGLPTLVAEALAADHRIDVIATHSVAGAAQALAASLSSAQRAAEAAQLLGMHCLVQATLRRAGDRLRLDYRSHGALDLRGRLQGTSVTSLGERLAGVVEQGLFPNRQWPVEFISSNALANEAFARAVDVGQREAWTEAARLLRVVLDIEPGSMPARLQYLRVLANVLDAQAVPLGEALLADAQRAGDVRTLAMAHEALGRALFNIDGPGHAVRASRHLDESLRLAAAYEGEDWVQRVYIGQALDAQVRRHRDRAVEFYERALAACESSGNLMRRALVLNNRARLEFGNGNLLVARELGEESLAIARRHRLDANAVDALCNLACIDAGLGLFRRAQQHCDQAIAGLRVLPPHEQASATWVLVIAGELQAECRTSGLLARALAEAPRGAALPLPSDSAVASAGDAFVRWAEGDSAGACAAMRSAVDGALSAGWMEYAHDFATELLWLQLRAGAYEAAAAFAAETARLPLDADDTGLASAVGYARAAGQHAAGDPAGALAALEAVAAAAPLGRWRARASIDAAWLALEAGDLPRALRLLRDHGAWLEEHPAGIAVRARTLHAQGRHERAAALQRGALEATDDAGYAWLAVLQEGYGEAAATLPTSPRLACLI